MLLLIKPTSAWETFHKEMGENGRPTKFKPLTHINILCLFSLILRVRNLDSPLES